MTTTDTATLAAEQVYDLACELDGLLADVRRAIHADLDISTLPRDVARALSRLDARIGVLQGLAAGMTQVTDS